MTIDLKSLPLIVPTQYGACADVFRASLYAYGPKDRNPVWLGGDDPVHERMNRYIAGCHSEWIAFSHDDVVLHPDTYDQLNDELNYLVAEDVKVALLCSRSDKVAGIQSITWAGPEAGQLVSIPYVFPVFAVINRDAWNAVGGLRWSGWFGDNDLCFRLRAAGYELVASQSYVHHVGSATNGRTPDDIQRDATAGAQWLIENNLACAIEIGVATR